MLSERALAGALALTALIGTACDRRPREQPASRPSLSGPAVPGQKSAGACTLAPIPVKLPIAPQKRLVAIGDLHGDLGGTRAALRAAGAINISDSWIGGDMVIVQTGDILDRGDDEDEIYELLERLEAEARAAGGAIILLNGNHELMNAAHDFRYVTPGSRDDFGGDRKAAFEPGGPWAKRLARYNIVAIIGDTVFSHAGVLTEWAPQVEEVNQSSRCWLDGQAGGHDQPPVALTSDNSPVWTRAYGMAGRTDCNGLAVALGKLGAKRMVIGHTVQPAGITSDCDGALWRIDVGLAAHYGGPIQVLEVSDSPRVLTGTR